MTIAVYQLTSLGLDWKALVSEETHCTAPYWPAGGNADSPDSSPNWLRCKAKKKKKIYGCLGSKLIYKRKKMGITHWWIQNEVLLAFLSTKGIRWELWTTWCNCGIRSLSYPWESTWPLNLTSYLVTYRVRTIPIRLVTPNTIG